VREKTTPLAEESKVILPEGSQSVCCWSGDPASAGSRNGGVKPPLYQTDPVVLSNEVKPADLLPRARFDRDKNAPLQVGNRTVLPSVTRVFRTNQTLSVYLESYAGNAPPPPTAQSAASGPAPPSSVALVFLRHGRKFAEAGPSRRRRATARMRVPQRARRPRYFPDVQPAAQARNRSRRDTDIDCEEGGDP
jgi:hypothetical protein